MRRQITKAFDQLAKRVPARWQMRPKRRTGVLIGIAAVLLLTVGVAVACSGSTNTGNHNAAGLAERNAETYVNANASGDYATSCGLTSAAGLAGYFGGSVQKCIKFWADNAATHSDFVTGTQYKVVKSELFAVRGVTGKAVELVPSDGTSHQAVAIESGTQKVIGSHAIEGTDLDMADPLAATMVRILPHD